MFNISIKKSFRLNQLIKQQYFNLNKINQPSQINSSVNYIQKQMKFFGNEANENKVQEEEEESEQSQDEEPDVYTKERAQDFNKLYEIKYKKIPGYATPEGTLKYSLRNKGVSKNHFRSPFNNELKLSSIGIGSFEKTYDEQTDKMIVFNSCIDAVQSGGCNVLETSINSMGMSGERTLGAVIRYLQESQNIQREELFISTKHGKLTEDTDQGISGTKLVMKLLKDKIIKDSDVSERKCLHPEFLKDQFEQSLNNIGVECLDLVYLNEPNDSSKNPQFYYDKIARAFEFYQSKVEEGQLRYYGIDSWEGFRVSQKDEFIHLRLQRLHEIAKKVAGENNQFKFIQFPMNIFMHESLTDEFQEYNPNLIVDMSGKTISNVKNLHEDIQEQRQEHEIEKNEQQNQNSDQQSENSQETQQEIIEEQDVEFMTIFKVASKLNINVVTKSVLDSGNVLSEPIKESLIKLDSNIARHVQLIRSTPSDSYLTSILEPDEEDEIRENLQVLASDPIPAEEMPKIYKKLKIKIKDLN